MVVAYGTTECSGVISIPPIDASRENQHTTVGHVMEHMELKIVNFETGEVVPRGETGEIWARSIVVFAGYWNDPDKTAETLDNRGWYKTGYVMMIQ